MSILRHKAIIEGNDGKSKESYRLWCGERTLVWDVFFRDFTAPSIRAHLPLFVLKNI